MPVSNVEAPENGKPPNGLGGSLFCELANEEPNGLGAGSFTIMESLLLPDGLFWLPPDVKGEGFDCPPPKGFGGVDVAEVVPNGLEVVEFKEFPNGDVTVSCFAPNGLLIVG
jgi:hypothetical protein